MDDINCNKIYGIDTYKDVTPIMVRDAIIDCFYQAHEESLEQIKDLEKIPFNNNFDDFKRENVLSVIKSIFDEVGGDFDNPTKEILIKVVNGLKKYSNFFRDEKIINEHASEIMLLISKIK